uniref:E3 ubiquitin-protein ligase n=1 Tax=Caenorhabditis tropicalis TaxID=1561998 RepID=A0A1I7TNE0_9PELO
MKRAAPPNNFNQPKRSGPSIASDIDCPICHGKAIMPVTLACHHKMCFMCMKGLTMHQQTQEHFSCPLCRHQIDREFVNGHVQQISIYAQLPRNYDTLGDTDEQEEEEEDEDIKPDVEELNARMAAENASNATAVQVGESSNAVVANDAVSENRAVRREDCSSEHYWLYECRSAGWWRYEARDEKFVDAAYRDPTAGVKRIVLTFGKPYMFDFDRMVQYQEGDMASERKIEVVDKDQMRNYNVVGTGGVRQADVWTVD